MKETYNVPFVAFPITESPLLGHLRSIRFRTFYHLSVYSMTYLDNEKLSAVRDLISVHSNILGRVVFQPEKLDFIGIHGKTLALRIKNSAALTELRSIFEERFPENASVNPPFLPHITIKVPPLNINVPKIDYAAAPVEDFFPKRFDVYYRTEAGIRAVCASYKI